MHIEVMKECRLHVVDSSMAWEATESAMIVEYVARSEDTADDTNTVHVYWRIEYNARLTKVTKKRNLHSHSCLYHKLSGKLFW